jgi:ATP-dependent DNA ligase
MATTLYPTISAALAKIRHEAEIDGELVGLNEHGRSGFQPLQKFGRNSARHRGWLSSKKR